MVGWDEQALRDSLREVFDLSSSRGFRQRLHYMRNAIAARKAVLEAGKELQEALRIREQVQGRWHPDLIPILQEQAMWDAWLAPGEVAPLYDRALAIGEKAYGPDDSRVAHALEAYASSCRKGAKRRGLYERAYAIRLQHPGLDPAALLRITCRLANIYYEGGNAGKVLPLWQQTVTVLERAQRPRDPLLSDALEGFGEAYQRAGDLAKAEEAFTRAVNIEEYAGREGGATVYLVPLLRAQHRTADEERLHLRLLRLRTRLHGPDNYAVLDMCADLARFYEQTHDLAQAERYWRQGLAIAEGMWGLRSRQADSCRQGLLDIYRQEGKQAEAAALEARMKVLAPGSAVSGQQ